MSEKVSPVRIDGNGRVGNAAGRPGAGAASSAVPFRIGEGPSAAAARPAAAVAAVTSLDALLALQAVEDPLVKRKKLVRRGASLLDVLDEVRSDLLVGRFSEAKLTQLMHIISEGREQTEPGLDGLLDDIELRVRVELAKRGLFPA